MSALRVAVFGGGTSPERGISLESAAAVLDRLPRDEFDPFSVEILEDGAFRIDGDEPVPAPLALAQLVERGTDVVFPALHGRFGEDGTVQGFLQTAGLPYVGSGVAASALAMDKCRTRDVLSLVGFSMPPAVELQGIDAGTAATAVFERFGLPVVVKDPTGGSSLDVTLARDRGALEGALAELLGRPGGRVLVERYAAGREFTVPVLGNASVGEDLRALPAVLIVPLRSDWFDFETKYDPGAVDEIVPAPCEPDLLDRLAALAIEAHRTLRCDGLTRTDFIVPEDGTPLFLEVNTIPGLTPVSICPRAAEAAGMPFGELLRLLVRMAVARHEALRGKDER